MLNLAEVYILGGGAPPPSSQTSYQRSCAVPPPSPPARRSYAQTVSESYETQWCAGTCNCGGEGPVLNWGDPNWGHEKHCYCDATRHAAATDEQWSVESDGGAMGAGLSFTITAWLPPIAEAASGAAEAASGAAVTATASPPPPPVTATTCSETCRYASDGDCDDGGPGSEFAWCDLGSDCTDCGERPPMLAPPPMSRRLAVADEAHDAHDAPMHMPLLGNSGSSAAGARRLLGAFAPSDDDDDDDDNDDDDDEAMAMPAAARAGARRLLKGGSSGYGGSSGGRSSSSYSAPRSGSATAPRSTATVSSGSRTYGGRTTYVVRGSGAARPHTYHSASYYNYRYNRDRYTDERFYVVGPWGYGCYSCNGADRNCYRCVLAISHHLRHRTPSHTFAHLLTPSHAFSPTRLLQLRRLLQSA